MCPAFDAGDHVASMLLARARVPRLNPHSAEEHPHESPIPAVRARFGTTYPICTVRETASATSCGSRYRGLFDWCGSGAPEDSTRRLTSLCVSQPRVGPAWTGLHVSAQRPGGRAQPGRADPTLPLHPAPVPVDRPSAPAPVRVLCVGQKPAVGDRGGADGGQTVQATVAPPVSIVWIRACHVPLSPFGTSAGSTTTTRSSADPSTR